MGKTKVDLAAVQNVDELPDVIAALEVRRAAERQTSECEHAVEALEAQLNGADDTTIQQLAVRVLAGEQLATVSTDAVALVGKLANAREHLRIANAAEQLASERLEAARAAALEAIVPAARERYSEAIAACAAALISLKKAAAAEVQVRRQYDGPTGIQLFPTKLHPMPLPYDVQRVGHWITEAVQHGLLSADVLAEFNSTCRGGDWRNVV